MCDVWSTCRRRGDAGATTAEYAVGTVGAALIGAVLIPVVPDLLWWHFRRMLEAVFEVVLAGAAPFVAGSVPVPW